MKRILCFGDSNTWGYVPNTQDKYIRYSDDVRWTCLLSKKLGDEYCVIEEGMNGRTTVFEDLFKPFSRAIDYIVPCLISQAPLDLVIVMLGTNDLKETFGQNEFYITQGLKRVIELIRQTSCGWNDDVQPEILIMAPPPIGENVKESCLADLFDDRAVERSHNLAVKYKELAKLMGCHFADTAPVADISEIDCLHLTEKGHKQISEMVYSKVKEIIG